MNTTDTNSPETPESQEDKLKRQENGLMGVIGASVPFGFTAFMLTSQALTDPGCDIHVSKKKFNDEMTTGAVNPEKARPVEEIFADYRAETKAVEKITSSSHCVKNQFISGGTGAAAMLFIMAASAITYAKVTKMSIREYLKHSF